MIEYVHVALATVLALIVLVRCVCVIHHMNPSSRTRHYAGWLGFGVSYAVLAVAALGSAFHISEGAANIGDWLWLVASAGLIAFDRRGASPERRSPSMHIVRNHGDGAIHRERQQA